MTPRDFVYWLQGYLELAPEAGLSPAQIVLIREHLKLVLDKKTPELIPAVPFDELL